jgi:hypothetical protein
MLEAFAASGNYPAHLIPLPTVASEFIDKRRASAERVQDAFQELENNINEEVGIQVDIAELREEMLKFVENEKELQSPKPIATNPKPKEDSSEDEINPSPDSPDVRDGTNESKINKNSDETIKVFEAYEELANKITEQLNNQETTALLQKARINGVRQLANFWRNKQLSFLCEVVDLSETNEGNLYFLRFRLIEDSDLLKVQPISNFTNRIEIQVPASRLGAITPGKRFRLSVNVASSLDPINDELQVLGSVDIGSSKANINFRLYMTRINIDWIK